MLDYRKGTLSPNDKERLWKLIDDVQVTMLTTIDGGELKARPMNHVQNHFDGRIWFFVNKESSLVKEIGKNHDVCLVYADVTNEIYVYLNGFAHFVRDQALIKELWNPFLRECEEQGQEDKNLGLLEVIVEEAQFWDKLENKMVAFDDV